MWLSYDSEQGYDFWCKLLGKSSGQTTKINFLLLLEHLHAHVVSLPRVCLSMPCLQLLQSSPGGQFENLWNMPITLVISSVLPGDVNTVQSNNNTSKQIKEMLTKCVIIQVKSPYITLHSLRVHLLYQTGLNEPVQLYKVVFISMKRVQRPELHYFSGAAQ